MSAAARLIPRDPIWRFAVGANHRLVLLRRCHIARGGIRGVAVQRGTLRPPTLEAVAPDRSGPLLVHIATDGESYGHHHRGGNMALTFALRTIEAQKLARITVYGEYLELHPPQWEVEIVERSSWSCTHGVERWWTDCGCNAGRHPGGNQGWRTPLREALDWLRDSLAPAYEQKMRETGVRPVADPQRLCPRHTRPDTCRRGCLSNRKNAACLDARRKDVRPPASRA